MGHDFKIEAIPTARRKYADWTKSIRRSAFLCLLLAIPMQAAGGELHSAVQAGDVATVKSLLASGAGIDETDFFTGTALHTAVGQGSESIVEVLIEHGADLEAKSELNSARALHLAADFDELAIIALLLDNGADIEARDGELRTPLHRAAELHDLQDLLAAAEEDRGRPTLRQGQGAVPDEVIRRPA